jgi:hypothetical protein
VRQAKPLAAAHRLEAEAKKDGIYRASLRGDSTYIRAQAEAVASELQKGDIRVEPGKKSLVETREEIVRGGTPSRTILTMRSYNAGVEGSSPSLSTNRISHFRLPLRSHVEMARKDTVAIVNQEFVLVFVPDRLVQLLQGPGRARISPTRVAIDWLNIRVE